MAATNIEETGSKVRNLVADSTRETTESLKGQLSRLQDELSNIQSAVSRNARYAVDTADSFVHDNPWKSAGLAALMAAVAVAAAMLASRR